MIQNLHKIIPTSQGSLMLPGRPTSPSPKSKAGAKALTSAKALHDLCSYPPNEATKRNKATKCNKIQQTLHFKPEDWTCGYDGISDDIMIYYGHHTFVFDRELGALSRSEFVGLQSHFWAPTNAAHMRTEH